MARLALAVQCMRGQPHLHFCAKQAQRALRIICCGRPLECLSHQ
jgi:hypothetical protein